MVGKKPLTVRTLAYLSVRFDDILNSGDERFAPPAQIERAYQCWNQLLSDRSLAGRIRTAGLQCNWHVIA